jgi:hypothetical protein
MSYKHEDARHGYEQAVDAHPADYAWSEWHIYPEYRVGEHEGRRYIYAPMADSVRQLRGRTRYRPLSRPTAALFLEFARWPETEGMDREPLGIESNEAAALEWAEIHGVLGLSSPQPFTVFDEASGAIEHSLGVHAIHPRHRNEGNGGLEETVEAFAREAWVANMALRLFEAATNLEGPDMDTIVGYMPDEQDGFGEHLPSVRQLHGASPRHACSWALQVVEEIVEDRMRGHVWPLPVRDYNGHPHGYAGHKQGWAFDSLLGAMWLQMMWLMRGQPRRCEWCGKLLDVDSEQDEELQIGGAGIRRKPRNDRRFCPSRDGVKDKCKADWNYHRGTGKSSKEARRRARQDS